MKQRKIMTALITIVIMAIFSTAPVLALGKININTASKWRLQKLPGVGESIAEKIIIYRRTIGSFETVGELNDVPGIGLKTVNAVRNYATVGALCEKKM